VRVYDISYSNKIRGLGCMIESVLLTVEEQPIVWAEHTNQKID
jgi:hypothetical protein